MPLIFGSLQAEARSAGGDRGTRKERSDRIAERNGASRFRYPIKERSGERGKVRNKKTSGKRAALFLDRFKPKLEALVEIEGLEPATSAM